MHLATVDLIAVDLMVIGLLHWADLDLATVSLMNLFNMHLVLVAVLNLFNVDLTNVDLVTSWAPVTVCGLYVLC